MPREFKTIMCPMDFSEQCIHAAEYGVRFARNSGGVVLLPHIIHVPAGELFEDGHAAPGALRFDEVRQRAREMLEEIRAKRLGEFANCELVTDVGDPAEQIIALAKERDVDLIVTATHGRSGFAHLVMGSVAEKVIRHAPCPVLVVRAGVE